MFESMYDKALESFLQEIADKIAHFEEANNSILGVSVCKAEDVTEDNFAHIEYVYTGEKFRKVNKSALEGRNAT